MPKAKKQTEKAAQPLVTYKAFNADWTCGGIEPGTFYTLTDGKPVKARG